MVEGAATPAVLVACADPARRGRVAAAIVRAGAVPLERAAVPPIAEGPIAQRLVVADAAYVLAGLADRLDPAAQLAAVADPAAPVAPEDAALPRLARLLAARDDRCAHVVTDDEAGLDHLEATVRALRTGELFGIERRLPAGATVHLARFDDYAGRTRALDELIAAAAAAGLRGTVRALVAQAVDELLMNALYDAPIDAHGRALFADTGTRDRLAERSPRPVSLRWSLTDRALVIAVRDRFGRLDRPAVRRHLERCLVADNDLDRKKLGAGLGLFLVLRAASCASFSVAPGVTTEVVCSFDRRGARTGARCFSFFEHPGVPNAGDSLRDYTIA